MTIESLFEQLKHPNPNLRQRAMLELAEVRDENTIPRLMSNLGEEDVVYRRACVKALGVIGFDAVPPLIDVLLDPNKNSTIRTSCAKALAQIAVNYPDIPFPPEGIEALKTAVQDSDPLVNLTSVMTLGVIGSPVVDILIEALKSTDNIAVAVAIINALGSINDKRAEEALTAFANDESADSYIRESATSALSRLEMVMKYNPS
jgi:bilin biosynthesis protein